MSHVKKEYVKARITVSNISAGNNFMTLSKGEIIPIDCFEISNNSFTNGGTWNEVFKGEIGGSTGEVCLKNLFSNAKPLYDRGFRDNDKVIIKKVATCPGSPQSNDAINIEVTYLGRCQ